MVTDSPDDEFVSATPDSTPAKLIQPQMFQYFTPENSPGYSKMSSISSESFVAETPQVVPPPNAPVKGSKRNCVSEPPARKKLPFGPRRYRTRRQKIDFKNSLYQVLRKIDPNGTISSKAMDVLNDMMIDLLERLCKEAQNIREMNGVQTLTPRDFQTAARILLPGQLSGHAFYTAQQCLAKYYQACDGARQN